MMCSYVQKILQKTTENPTGLKNKFNKFGGYKVKIQNSEVFLYTSSEKSKNEIKKTTAFK